MPAMLRRRISFGLRWAAERMPVTLRHRISLGLVWAAERVNDLHGWLNQMAKRFR